MEESAARGWGSGGSVWEFDIKIGWGMQSGGCGRVCKTEEKIFNTECTENGAQRAQRRVPQEHRLMPVLLELFVGEGIDGVDAGGAQGGDGGAEGGTDDGEADGAGYPAGCEEDGEAGIGLFEDGLGEESDGDAENAAGDGEEEGFAEEHFDNVEAGKAEGFEDADFAGAFKDHGVHVHQDNQEADDDAEADHGLNKWF